LKDSGNPVGQLMGVAIQGLYDLLFRLLFHQEDVAFLQLVSQGGLSVEARLKTAEKTSYLEEFIHGKHGLHGRAAKVVKTILKKIYGGLGMQKLFVYLRPDFRKATRP
jgi:hypothetical protein